MVVHLPGEFSRGKGQRSNGGWQEKGADKSFCGPRQKFWRRSLTLRMTTRRCLSSPPRENGQGRWPHRGTGCTHPTRRNGVAPSECRQLYRRHGESGATGTDAANAAVDLDVRHQTLAVRPETALRVRRSPQVRSSCPGECGSTTGQRSWSGAEGSIALPLVMVQPLFAKPLRSKTEMRNGPLSVAKHIINANVRIH